MTSAETELEAGFSSRSQDLDVFRGFVNPPAGYGEVAFYWWVGEPLTKERLTWQLEQLKDHHISGLQINYGHSDEGGDAWGLTYPSDPPLFSEAWWELFAWFAEKAGTYGIAVSLSDYTLCGPGQGWYTDEIRARKPDITGTNLAHLDWLMEKEAMQVERQLPTDVISAGAFLTETDEQSKKWINLIPFIHHGKLLWDKPDGSWHISIVYAEHKPRSIDPMHPDSGVMVIEHFFARFEERLSGIDNAKLGFFFSDELEFGIRGKLWNDRFREAFMSRKGYDIVDELSALFIDIGPRTAKIRLDYGDVMVSLSEEHYFIPIFEWHQERGMIYGCDHGGRGKDITEFGDYFRTQRWNQGPGCDQPDFESDLIKNKVASSIAHLYERPRTWLEGFYGTGWGTTTSDVTDAIFRNFVSGHNLLTLHGLYYTTFGGWWEWAPPCNHFRMPYWEHMETLLACTERLSYLLSQGVHVCDVAIVYPVAAMEAGLDGEASVRSAFGVGEHLYKQGIDFDFIDFQSIERSSIEDRKLCVAGEAYRVLIMPSMRAVRYSMLEKARMFHEAGGIVIALDRLPEASERMGAFDSLLDDTVRALFGWTSIEAAVQGGSRAQRNEAGGTAYTAHSFEEVEAIINGAFPRDFACGIEDGDSEVPYVMHRRIGFRDMYAIYGGMNGSECFFRSHGKIELWNPWDGTVTRLEASRITAEGTYIKLPLSRTEIQLIVFTNRKQIHAEERVPWEPRLPNESISLLQSMPLDGEWGFELRPTMDNQFGDFRQPPEDSLIGAEARQFRFSYEDHRLFNTEEWRNAAFNDFMWEKVTYGYGPYLWQFGPLRRSEVSEDMENEFLQLKSAPSEYRMEASGSNYEWSRYVCSTRYGIEGDPGHQGYHGLKGEITNDFIAIGRPSFDLTGTQYDMEEDSIAYLWSSFHSIDGQSVRLRMGGILPEKLWLNGEWMEEIPDQLKVERGVNTVLLRYGRAGRGHVLFESLNAPEKWKQPLPLAMTWHNKPGSIAYDAYPDASRPLAGWYRFTAPPGLEGMELAAFGTVQVWVNGVEWKVDQVDAIRHDGAATYQVTSLVKQNEVSLAAVRIAYDTSNYAGAALPDPIRLKCGEGLIQAGDWSAIDGLTCYSGGAVYRRQLEWAVPERSQEYRAILELGDVSASAEIRVNGQHVRTLVREPWTADIAPWLLTGDNVLEVYVCNTLANHYMTIPTRYRGELASGLLGPVTLNILVNE
ncbi:glycosyl hydrolase [Paenibacillus sp. HB172176]|uniref:glycosyl hydrolase n=1 Tax=Paenibacillus sp. HB172176 TaxID=2493690 RepID=UPI00143B3886|nr:glycosyl hydrolase [Paenibacillus sp. HB172176]